MDVGLNNACKMKEKKAMLCGLLRHKRKCQEQVEDPTYMELNDDEVCTLLEPCPVTPPPVTPFKIPRMELLNETPVVSTPGSGEGDTLYCQEGLTELSNSGGYYPVGGFRTKGQLKLAITVEGERLTVHVIKARHLNRHLGSFCSSFVEVSLHPDLNNNSRSTTEAKNNTNKPVFEEKFTYEMMEEDKRKRLMVSMYNKDSGKCCAKELLGCMSFGIKHLVSKKKKMPVEGWYYLLSKDLGKRKHLSATNTSTSTEDCKTSTECLIKAPSESKLSQKDTISIASTLSLQSHHGAAAQTITVVKNAQGFGFTVRGSCPVKVGRVKQGSTAEAAGLQKGDRIIKINGQNVCRSGAESIAAIVKNAETQVVLDIQRPTRSTTSLSSGAESKYCGPDGESDHHENDENVAPEPVYTTVKERRVSYKVSEYIRRECSYAAESATGQWHPGLSVITEETVLSETVQNQTVKSTRSTKWDPELSDIPRVESMRTFSHQSQSLHHMSMSTVNNESHSVWTPACSLVSEDDSRWRYEVDSQNSSCEDVRSKIYDTTATTTDFTQDESDRQAAIEAVAECEDDFVNLMHCGIQMFSRPLRHYIMSSTQHAAIFQNVEKLVAISEYLLKGLQESESSSDDFSTLRETLTSNLGAIFMPKVKVLCEAYMIYAKGLSHAFTTLDELRKNPEFRRYLRKLAKSDIGLTLEYFMKQPLRHLVELLSGIERVLFATPIDHPDFNTLKDVLEEIGTTCNELEDNNTLNTQINDTLATIQSSYSQASNRSTASLVTVDSEVLDLQNRLKFPRSVQPFQVVAPSRHLIFSGELQHLSSSGIATDLTAALLNDMMILTQQLHDGQLVAMDDPIYLQDIVAMDFDCDDAAEFTIIVEKLRASGTLGREARHYTLRAPSAEQKWTWRNLLEQHIQASKYHSQTSLASSDIFI